MKLSYSTGLSLFILLFSVFCNLKAQDVPADSTKAGLYFNRAEVFGSEGNYDSAIYYFQKASEIYKNETDWPAYLAVTNKWVDILWSKSEKKEGMERAKFNLRLAEKYLVAEHVELAEANYQLARFYHHDYFEYDSAEYFYNKSRQILDTSRQDSIGKNLEIRLLQQLGGLNQLLGFYSEAINNLNSALHLENKMSFLPSKNKCLIYNTLGTFYWYMTSYQQALMFYKQALAVSNELYGSQNGLVGSINMNIGLAYTGIGNYQKAIEHFERGGKHWKNKEKYKNLATVYENISAVYVEQNMPDSAEYQLNKIIDLLGVGPNVIRRLYPNMGIIKRMQGKEQIAIGYFQKGLEEAVKVLGEKNLEVANIYYEWALVYD